MQPNHRQLVLCCAEQWMHGIFEQVQPWEDGLRLGDEAAPTGYYALQVLDSGEEDFTWHRLVLEADLPPDTALTVYARAAEEPQWSSWEQRKNGELSMQQLKEQFGPPVGRGTECYLPCRGRYVWILLELTATGTARPTVRSMTFWMGGDHMIDYLPSIYQEEDFTRRFLSIFDSMFSDLERAIESVPSMLDAGQVQGPMLSRLAQWLCIDGADTEEELRQRIGSALEEHQHRYTVAGVHGAIRRLTGQEPVVLEHFQVSPNRPDCRNPAVYRRLYGEDPNRIFVLLPEGSFATRQQRTEFERAMEQHLPAGLTMEVVLLRQALQLDSHTYVGINARLSQAEPARMDDQSTLQYNMTIGGVGHE